ncbi:hypothetical protein OPQ81_007271 [Rhizoctonia solani]|nr:hypothetical protein OPQ81_007271 [Rhizoctonia solani]
MLLPELYHIALSDAVVSKISSKVVCQTRVSSAKSYAILILESVPGLIEPFELSTRYYSDERKTILEAFDLHFLPGWQRWH